MEGNLQDGGQDGSNSTKLRSLTLLLSTSAVPPCLVLCYWILPLPLETCGRLGKDLVGPSPKYSLTGRAAGKGKLQEQEAGWISKNPGLESGREADLYEGCQRNPGSSLQIPA